VEGLNTPLVLRGTDRVLTWMLPGIDAAPESTRHRLLQLYEQTDPALATALENGMALEGVVGSEKDAREQADSLGKRWRPVLAAQSLGRALASEEGPRVGVLSISGWDTHLGQGSRKGPLYNALGNLDRVLETLGEAMAPAWRDTAIAVVTEFGRTVGVNGTRGTDHGTASAAFLLGGAVRGGRVVGDWPGLSPSNLHQRRDLAATTEMRAFFKGVLQEHFDAPSRLLANGIFPESGGIRPMHGLIRG